MITLDLLFCIQKIEYRQPKTRQTIHDNSNKERNTPL